VFEKNIPGYDDMILMKLVDVSGCRCSYPPLMKYIMEKYGGCILGMVG